MRKFICTIIASAFFFAGAIFSATTAEAKQPIEPNGKVMVCGAVKVGKFWRYRQDEIDRWMRSSDENRSDKEV